MTEQLALFAPNLNLETNSVVWTPKQDVAPVPTQKIFPYPFQQKVIDEVHVAIARQKKSITLGAATGSGKTVMASQLKRDFLDKGLRTLFVVNRDILVTQTLETLEKFGVSGGVIAGGRKENRLPMVQVASVQTLARRDIGWFDWDVVIFDEAHLTAWSNWGLETIRNLGDRRAILLTATPFRLSKKESFSQISDALIKAPSTLELIEMGKLTKPRYMVAAEPNTKTVKTRAGEFKTEDLSVVCDTPEVIANFYEAYIKHVPGKPCIAFTVNVAHAKNVAEMGAEFGVRAAYVSGDTPRHECKRLYEMLANGELDVLASCEKLSEGFDVKAIAAVALMRPTKSKAKYIQQVGRGLRTYPGKDECLVLCLSGNVRRFGFVEDIEIKFEDLKDKKPGDVPLKVCRDENTPGAGCGSLVHASLKTCPHCGFEFPSKDDEKVRFSGDFTELIPSWRMSRFDRYCELLDDAYQKNWKPGSASYQYKEWHEEQHKKTMWPDSAWASLWVQSRGHKREIIRLWLSLLSQKHNQPDIEKAWMVRFFPEVAA